MKLKYYLRGVGIGIIFATLVMTVSSLVHKYNITDEYIIKEARKLGMVMKNELEDKDDLFGKDETEDTQGSESESVVPSESESESQTPPPSESESQTPPPSESESQTPPPSESESQTPPPSESESQTPPPSESESQTPPPSESESQTPPSESESQTPPSESESQTPPASEEKQYVYVKIEPGDYARQVAERVKAAGLIKDAEDFRKYIGRKGYGQLFHAGTYKIPVGADYEEICQILISR